MVIKYKSENGYEGMLYGESSMVIYDPEGNEVFRSGFRTINTEAELKEFVDDMPNKQKGLLDFYRSMSKGEK